MLCRKLTLRAHLAGICAHWDICRKALLALDLHKLQSGQQLR